MSKLFQLGSLRSGIHLRGAADVRPEGENYVIQLGDVRDGMVNWERVVRMEMERDRAKGFLIPGDILLRSRGASYGAALLATCPQRTLAAVPLYVFRLEAPEVEAAYVTWYINRPATQSRLGASARGTHVPTVSLEAFADLDIVLPGLAEQRRILDMEWLFQEEKNLNAQYLAQRGQLVQVAQETILEGASR